jgi:hypothetical protein
MANSNPRAGVPLNGDYKRIFLVEALGLPKKKKLRQAVAVLKARGDYV